MSFKRVLCKVFIFRIFSRERTKFTKSKNRGSRYVYLQNKIDIDGNLQGILTVKKSNMFLSGEFHRWNFVLNYSENGGVVLFLVYEFVGTIFSKFVSKRVSMSFTLRLFD